MSLKAAFEILINLICASYFALAAYLFLRWWGPDYKIPRLKDVSVKNPLPSVSVIFSARNEEENVGACLFSLSDQVELSNFEIIAINDRSTDNTGAIIHHFAKSRPDLTHALTIDSLPQGWLGKAHALWKGAALAQGEWLLFTDGDVKFSPRAVAQALSHAVDHELDHLTIFPDLESSSMLEDTLHMCFLLLTSFQVRFWKLKNRSAADAIGVGAFNLVRRSVYEAIGTHQAMALSVIDDVQLARLVKKHRFKSDTMVGRNAISLRWQKGLFGTVRGLEKNFFAGVGFSRFIACALILTCLFSAWGYLAGFFASEVWARSLTVVGLVLWLGVFLKARYYQRANIFVYFLLPIGLTLMGVAMGKSMRKTLKDGGIWWRDTFYPIGLFPKPRFRDLARLIRGRV